MARSKDTPCAGCGELLWTGSTSLPAGERLCRPCRRLRPKKKQLVRRNGSNRLTSQIVYMDCSECGSLFVCRSQFAGFTVTCSPVCSSRRKHRLLPIEDRRAKQARRRARLRNAKVEVFPHLEVFQRDGWLCGLCGKKVDPKLTGTSDMRRASLDHIIPLSKGGEHSRANTQCSHLGCNLRKNNKPAGEQLRLIG